MSDCAHAIKPFDTYYLQDEFVSGPFCPYCRIQQLESERRWIPVSERLPEIGQTVLNYRVGGANRHADVEFAVREKKYGTRREDNIWEWITCGNQAGRYWGLSVDGSEVTHWMPLPPPPINGEVK